MAERPSLPHTQRGSDEFGEWVSKSSEFESSDSVHTPVSARYTERSQPPVGLAGFKAHKLEFASISHKVSQRSAATFVWTVGNIWNLWNRLDAKP